MSNFLDKSRLNLPDCLIFLFPATSILIPGGGELIFAISAIAGVITYIKHRVNNKVSHTLNSLAIFSIALSLIFFIKLLSVTWSITPSASLRDTGTHIHFLFAFPITYIFLQSSKIENQLKYGTIFATICAGLFATYHIIRYGFDFQNLHFEAFAQNSLVLALLASCFLGWLIVWQLNTPSRNNTIAILFASILIYSTGRRTGLLALLALSFGIPYFASKSLPQSLKSNFKKALLITALLLFTVITLSFSSWQKAYHEILTFTNNSNNVTSVGDRLKFYQIGSQAIIESPFWGQGAGTTRSVVKKFNADPSPPTQGHFHNFLLQSLVDVGLLGTLITLLALTAAFKLLIFPSRIAKPSTLLAIAVIISYLIFGLTNLAFKQGLQNSFFILSISMLLAIRIQSSISK